MTTTGQGNGHWVADTSGPAEVTLHHVHHQVCSARVRRCPPGRMHHARRHLPVSHYRAAGHFQIDSNSADVLQQNKAWSRKSLLTVVLTMAAVGLVYLVLLRVLLPAGSQQLLLGVFLIIIAGAIVLNAMTVEAMNSPGGTGRGSTQR